MKAVRSTLNTTTRRDHDPRGRPQPGPGRERRAPRPRCGRSSARARRTALALEDDEQGEHQLRRQGSGSAPLRHGERARAAGARRPLFLSSWCGDRTVLARANARHGLSQRTLAFGLASALIVAPGSAARRQRRRARGAAHTATATTTADTSHGSHGALVPSAGNRPTSPPRASASRARSPGSVAAVARARPTHTRLPPRGRRLHHDRAPRARRLRRRARFQVRGGSVGELAQRWCTTTRPADGAEVVLGTDASGKQGWTHYEDGSSSAARSATATAIRIAQ